MIDYQVFFTKMCQAVQEAGTLAKNSQGNIQNIGKDAEQVSENETERLKAKRNAKTAIDVEVQELLLKAAVEVINPLEILLDAEEESDTVKLFSKDTNLPISLIIDPIDGTLEYIEGKEYYSVCVGIIENSKVKMVLVYFPIRDILYAVDPYQKSYLVRNFSKLGYKQPETILISQQSEKVIYKNSRVPERIVTNLTQAGFHVLDDTYLEIGCPDAILSIINGKCIAYLSDSRQMRDILLGAVIGYAENGFMSDWQGNDLTWLKQGRLPKAMFGNLLHKTEIQKNLLGQ